MHPHLPFSLLVTIKITNQEFTSKTLKDHTCYYVALVSTIPADPVAALLSESCVTDWVLKHVVLLI